MCERYQVSVTGGENRSGCLRLSRMHRDRSVAALEENGQAKHLMATGNKRKVRLALGFEVEMFLKSFGE